MSMTYLEVDSDSALERTPHISMKDKFCKPVF